MMFLKSLQMLFLAKGLYFTLSFYCLSATAAPSVCPGSSPVSAMAVTVEDILTIYPFRDYEVNLANNLLYYVFVSVGNKTILNSAIIKRILTLS